MVESDALARVRRCLVVDATTVEVSRALGAAGIEHLLLKGPVTSTWLYAPDEVRGYRDTDLLIPQSRVAPAERVLSGLGFHDHHAGVLGLYRPDNERSWVRGQTSVDLHWRLVGVPPCYGDRAWRALWDGAQDHLLHGHRLRVMAAPARVMHLALHAAQSHEDAKAAEDLRRGLQLLDPSSWEAALALARDLGALPAAVAGLRTQPAGRSLLAALAIDAPMTARLVLVTQGQWREAAALARLMEVPRGSRLTVARGWLDAPPGRAGHRLRAAALVRLPAGGARYLMARRAVQPSAQPALC